MKIKRILIAITALAALFSCQILPMEPEDIWPEDTEVPVPSTDSLAYYHTQDGGYYYPSITKSIPTWDFVHLKRK